MYSKRDELFLFLETRKNAIRNIEKKAHNKVLLSQLDAHLSEIHIVEQFLFKQEDEHNENK